MHAVVRAHSAVPQLFRAPAKLGQLSQIYLPSFGLEKRFTTGRRKRCRFNHHSSYILVEEKYILTNFFANIF